jgi:ubiquinone/menaquinone biosynthesis C-methylase UbiE
MNDQRSIFLQSEGDAWFVRNKTSGLTGPDHIDDYIVEQISESHSVLEIGCAEGRRLSRLRTRIGNQTKLVGIDPSKEAIRFGSEQFSDLDLRVGTADSLPGNEYFDAVILGFCLYLCDRNLLSKIVSEVDRVLNDLGFLMIIDFDPSQPHRRKYKHHESVWSYKMDYSQLFSVFPHYVLSEKFSLSHSGPNWVSTESERIAIWTLRKNYSGGYSEELD